MVLAGPDALVDYKGPGPAADPDRHASDRPGPSDRGWPDARHSRCGVLACDRLGAVAV